MTISSWRNLVTDAAESLLLRPWHALAMTSGVVLGVGVAVASMIIADTQQATIDLRFDLQRSTISAVRAIQPTRSGFSGEQVRQIAELEPVRDAGEFSTWSERERVTPAGSSAVIVAPVIVADDGGLAATGASVNWGPTATSLRPGGVLIGGRLAKEAKISASIEGSDIDLNGRRFHVVGTISGSATFGYLNRSVVMVREDALRTFSGTGQNVRLLASVRPGAAGAVAKYMALAADPTGEFQLADVTPPDGRRLVKNVGDDLRRIGLAIGGFAGIAGMVGIANTLMMSVLNRRRELGLRSAMGWNRSRIALLILTESAAAGLVAGVFGAAIGSCGAAVLAWTQGWSLVVAPWLPATAVMGGIIASVLGGSIPAIRAASLSPMEAMRS